MKAVVVGVVLVLIIAAGIGGGNRGAPGAPEPMASDSLTTIGAAIPGLTAADVKLNIENRGLTCEGPSSFVDGIEYVCKDSSDATVEYFVDIVGLDPGDIRSVEATVLWYGDLAEFETRADAFLGFIATLPYDGATPEAAREWVQANVSGGITFGGAAFELATAETGRARILTITGA